MIARIEAKSAMSYLLCSSLTDDISILRSDFSYVALLRAFGAIAMHCGCASFNVFGKSIVEQ